MWNKLFGLRLSALFLFLFLSATVAAQINVVPVNGGTGSLVSIPIPGGSGLSVTVGTGSAAIPLQDIRSNPNTVNITTYDDSYNNVPLGFDFPFYGKVFNNSWAMTNGLVTFQDPNRSGLGGACCEGVDLRTTRDARYNYTIYAMHTDLYSPTSNNQYYLRGTNEMTYGWYNLSQCCGPQGGNSFEIKINSLGLVDTRIAGAMISGNRVTSGMAGDLSQGEYYQAYHGRGLSIAPGSANVFSWQALNGTGAVDMCTINPLSSPSCSGYQVAYTTQQCTVSALFDPSCPGYAAAYTTQQCSANPLFSQQCPGYQSAYLQQQCSIDPLYSTTCQGYATANHDRQCSLNTLYATDCPGYAAAYLTQQCNANPLYSTTCQGYAVAYKAQQCSVSPLYATDCPGYAQAYRTQQCSINTLYSSDCPGYQQAYHTQQCSINTLYATDCPGYAAAYKTQQCSINALYATDCPGYAVAYKNQQCTANALYATDCPGYAQAYFNQQCSLNALYNNQCPGYATAYATKMLLEQQNMASTVATAGVIASTAPSTSTPSTTPTVSSDGTVSSVTAVSTTGNSSVDRAIAAPAPTANSAAAPAAVVQLAPPPPPPAAMAPAPAKNEGSNDKPAGDKPAGGPTQTAQGDSKGSDKPAAPTAREALAERRQEAAKKEAVAKGANLANEMGKAADMEAQKAVQNVVIAAMGFTPGFDVYNKTAIPDANIFYRPFQVYNGQVNVDNKFVSRRLMGGSDKLHQDMVDEQYNREK